MTVGLRGLCWDHPRCTGPMAAAAAAYRRVQPDVHVTWDARPLAKFNDEPPWEVDGRYDLIYVDHPMSGGIAERRALVPFEESLAPGTLQRIAAESVGASHRSYAWAGRHWALGVDAACHVAATHTVRLAELGRTAPRTWADVLDLARSAPGAVALPLGPADAMCALISLSANASVAEGREAHWLDRQAVAFLVELAGLVDPACFDLNPSRLLARMTAGGPVAYVPLIFGYATLHRPPCAFTDVPGRDGAPEGAVLGGAGLGVLPTSAHVQEAADFAAWLMNSGVQRHVMIPAGGQPGNRIAWADARADEQTGGFLSATRRSIEGAYVRPRDPWWPAFQLTGGKLLATLLRRGASAEHIADEVEELASDLRGRPTGPTTAEPTPAEPTPADLTPADLTPAGPAEPRR